MARAACGRLLIGPHACHHTQLVVHEQIGQRARIHLSHRCAVELEAQVGHQGRGDLPIEPSDFTLDGAHVCHEEKATALVGCDAREQGLLHTRAQAHGEDPGIRGIGMGRLQRGLGIGLTIGQEQHHVGLLVLVLCGEHSLECGSDVGAACALEVIDAPQDLRAHFRRDGARLGKHQLAAVVKKHQIDAVASVHALDQLPCRRARVLEWFAGHAARMIDHQGDVLGGGVAARHLFGRGQMQEQIGVLSLIAVKGSLQRERGLATR